MFDSKKIIIFSYERPRNRSFVGPSLLMKYSPIWKKFTTNNIISSSFDASYYSKDQITIKYPSLDVIISPVTYNFEHNRDLGERILNIDRNNCDVGIIIVDQVNHHKYEKLKNITSKFEDVNIPYIIVYCLGCWKLEDWIVCYRYKGTGGELAISPTEGIKDVNKIFDFALLLTEEIENIHNIEDKETLKYIPYSIEMGFSGLLEKHLNPMSQPENNVSEAVISQTDDGNQDIAFSGQSEVNINPGLRLQSDNNSVVIAQNAESGSLLMSSLSEIQNTVGEQLSDYKFSLSFLSELNDNIDAIDSMVEQLLMKKRLLLGYAETATMRLWKERQNIESVITKTERFTSPVKN